MSLDDLVIAADGSVFVGYWALRGRGGGVARSDDGGKTFTVLPGISGQAVKALALAPTDPDIVIAGTLSGVFRSGNGGRSWKRISVEAHPELRNVNSIAIDPEAPGTIYVGTWHLPWKTTDGGSTWRSIHSGMINDSDVMTITLDRRSPRTVYAQPAAGFIAPGTEQAAGQGPGYTLLQPSHAGVCAAHGGPGDVLRGHYRGPLDHRRRRGLVGTAHRQEARGQRTPLAAGRIAPDRHRRSGCPAQHGRRAHVERLERRLSERFVSRVVFSPPTEGSWWA